MFVVVVGPTRYIFKSLIEDVGLYAYTFWPMMLRTGTFGQDSWVQSWTIFYWAWWISWAPFVGTFIARISKGRTIREFVLGVLLLPAAVSMVWFVIFGGTAIHLALTQGVGIVEAVEASQASALFALLDQFPLAGTISIAVMVLIVLWFVSGADAGAVVMGILCSRGSANPPRLITAFWGITAAVAAAVLLLAGGLTALQQTMVVMSAPFMVVMVILTLGTLKQLRAEPLPAIRGGGRMSSRLRRPTSWTSPARRSPQRRRLQEGMLAPERPCPSPALCGVGAVRWCCRTSSGRCWACWWKRVDRGADTLRHLRRPVEARVATGRLSQLAPGDGQRVIWGVPPCAGPSGELRRCSDLARPPRAA